MQHKVSAITPNQFAKVPFLPCSWTKYFYKSQTARTLTVLIHRPYERIQSTTGANTIKTCLFCDIVRCKIFLHPTIHEDIIHIHNHYTNPHIKLTKHRSMVDISNAIRMITDHLNHIPCTTHPSRPILWTTLLPSVHCYNQSTYPHLIGPPYIIISASSSFPYHTKIPHLPLNTFLNISVGQQCLLIIPDNKEYFVHIYSLVSTLPRNNYIRLFMDIIDNIYIYILQAILYKPIHTHTFAFATHQYTTHTHNTSSHHVSYPCINTTRKRPRLSSGRLIHWISEKNNPLAALYPSLKYHIHYFPKAFTQRTSYSILSCIQPKEDTLVTPPTPFKPTLSNPKVRNSQPPY